MKKKQSAKLKIYNQNPDKKKVATLELRKKTGFDYDAVQKLKEVNVIIDGFIAGNEIEDIVFKTNKSNKDKVSKVTSKCKLFSCDTCNFETRHVAAFKTHKTRIHKQIKKCEICVYYAETQSNFEEHIQKHHGPKPIYNCSDCDYVATLKAELDKHKLSTHEKEASYSCDFCEYEFKMQSSKQEHIKLNHKGNLKRTKEIISSSSYPPRKKQEMEKNIDSVELMDIEIETDSLIQMFEARIEQLEAET